MATRKRNPKNDAEGTKGDGVDERQERHEGAGTVEVHDAYLEHRLGGGAPADPAAYRRAFEQFRRLPGALRANPTVEKGDDRHGNDRNDENGAAS